ncbi:Domain of uncharacterised function (DUF2825) [Salmonella enterica subsp. salamae]|uniref:Domain of uncharacterized function (DUF2825) n=1 Tax=Salmonella enterica TaxID=28901 RepID=A0A379QWP4_SALER|nr:Domain of uncharacterised function (DUF2825) [Salmonella enterica]SUI19287.1 Domain of uncharacterised function (DUF2825) [Salmonella enterica subsp. salamae]
MSENIAVYPRWRGEHSIVTFDPAEKVGLSPLARGTLRHKNQKHF